MTDEKDNFLEQMFVIAATRDLETDKFKKATPEQKFEKLESFLSKTTKEFLAKEIKYGGGSNFSSIVFMLISKAQSTPESYYRRIKN